jgi:hypothetical protein
VHREHSDESLLQQDESKLVSSKVPIKLHHFSHSIHGHAVSTLKYPTYNQPAAHADDMWQTAMWCSAIAVPALLFAVSPFAFSC